MSAIGGYEQVISATQVLDVEGHSVRVLSLSHLIATKTAANRPKDLAVLPVLEAARQRQQQQGPPKDSASPES
jgi:hypothetical protein